MRGLFVRGMPLLEELMAVLDYLVQKQLPRLHKHIEEQREEATVRVLNGARCLCAAAPCRCCCLVMHNLTESRSCSAGPHGAPSEATQPLRTPRSRHVHAPSSNRPIELRLCSHQTLSHVHPHHAQ